MNRLTPAKQAQVIAALVEGNSIRAVTERRVARVQNLQHFPPHVTAVLFSEILCYYVI
jgi:hypothetical protein